MRHVLIFTAHFLFDSMTSLNMAGTKYFLRTFLFQLGILIVIYQIFHHFCPFFPPCECLSLYCVHFRLPPLALSHYHLQLVHRHCHSCLPPLSLFYLLLLCGDIEPNPGPSSADIVKCVCDYPKSPVL